MCEINWLLLLEYIKALLSWPTITLAIVLIVICRFEKEIKDFMSSVEEANIFGNKFKKKNQALAPLVDSALISPEISVTHNLNSNAYSKLPPELQTDSTAQNQLDYVRTHPEETVVEYRKLYFYYQAERLFARIYGTQISLLIYLEDNSNRSFSLTKLNRFHKEHQKLANRTDYLLDSYIDFLAGFQVISVSGTPEKKMYEINQYGTQFLSYIKANYPDDWDKKFF